MYSGAGGTDGTNERVHYKQRWKEVRTDLPLVRGRLARWSPGAEPKVNEGRAGCERGALKMEPSAVASEDNTVRTAGSLTLITF